MYVIFIIDVFARRIVAWHASTSKEVGLVATPLRMALWQRAHDGHPVKGIELINYSDAWSLRTASISAVSSASNPVASNASQSRSAGRAAPADHPVGLPPAMATRKIAPALAAGCTTVLKPAEQTP